MLLLFSHWALPDSLRPSGRWHTRPPCPASSPGVCSDSCPLTQCCHPAVSPSIVPFSFCPQSFPASESFPMSWLCVCACVWYIVIYKQWQCYFFLSNLDSFYFFFFFFLVWLLWLVHLVLCWIKVVRVGILVLSPVLEEMFSSFHHWWGLLWVCHILFLLCWGLFPLYIVSW